MSPWTITAYLIISGYISKKQRKKNSCNKRLTHIKIKFFTEIVI